MTLDNILSLFGIGFVLFFISVVTIINYVDATEDQKKEYCLKLMGLIYLDMQNTILDKAQRDYLHLHYGYNCMEYDYDKDEYLKLMEDIKHWSWEFIDDGSLKVEYND